MIQRFREVWLVDFEFSAPPGDRPVPICMVAREWRSGITIRLWEDELQSRIKAPYTTDANALLVAYYSSAELGCFDVLGWPMPSRILDLFVEFRCRTSGLAVPCGNSLLGALSYFGIDGIASAEKDSMRELALRGGPWSEGEKIALLDYCQSDVEALAKLLPAMLPQIDLDRALLRGRYMAAAARMESCGVPIDVELFETVRDNWTAIKSRLVEAVDTDYGVYVPTGRQIDFDTQFGSIVLQEAEEHNLDPYSLADAVDEIWGRERGIRQEFEAAKVAARKRTGLTGARMATWERAGRDHSTWPKFDVHARELAWEYPILGIGSGYVEDGYDDTDYSGRLWSILNEHNAAPKRDDPAILHEAVRTLREGNTAPHPRLTFDSKLWARWLAAHDVPWPRLPSGELALDDDTFRQMAKLYPTVAPIRELRYSMGQLRLSELAVGSDGRNRCLLSAFAARTGRNQPSNSKFIFGPAVWLRGLIRPAEGWALAYLDWEQQEFGIAAALSGDQAMKDAYLSGDPYLAFAIQAGAAPRDATKATHGSVREQFKACVLAVQYGMGPEALAQRLGIVPARARELLALHRQTYPTYWRWSEAALNHAMLLGHLHTVFGWTVHVGTDANPRSLLNFPMQANGAEILRLACCLATERGIRVCAPIHDAVLIEAPTEQIETAVVDCQEAMRTASEVALDGFTLRTEAKIVRWPDRYMDPRGQRMWDIVRTILADLNPATSGEVDEVELWDNPATSGDPTPPPVAPYPATSGTPSPLISLLSLTLIK